MNASRSRLIIIFSLTALISLVWAGYTQHVWEDYYITYRASKNLALGHGLVFTEGQRLHTFTSPLGVLLPALSSLLAFNRSDLAALWIFRIMSIAALGGAAVFLYSATQRRFAGGISALLLIGLFATDNKTIDYTINGMETGLLLFFLGWMLWTLFTKPERTAWHLGLSWAGLMWSRPDACVYIVAVILPSLVFQPTREERLALLRTSLKAAMIGAIVYLPWLIFAWAYYGTPIPHTITAKGLFNDHSVIKGLLDFPSAIFHGRSTLAATFIPAYGLSTGWPAFAIKASFWVSSLISILWILPRVRWEIRATSFAFLVGHFYLTAIVEFPIPWYIPIVTTLGIIALAMACGQVFAHLSARTLFPARVGRGLIIGATALLVAANATLAVCTAYNFRLQQRIVETGVRQQIGHWLRASARTPSDTVFLEPLGYIGYFSNLKMLDYPGLSSPEVVAARKKTSNHSYPFSWAELINLLRPDWVVLRPFEREYINRSQQFGFDRHYRKVQVFDATAEINAIHFLPGRAYLLNDAIFEIYQRTSYFTSSPGTLEIITPDRLIRKEAFSPLKTEFGVFYAHAPAVLSTAIPAGATRVQGTFGFNQAAYANPSAATDGADFSVILVSPDGSRKELFHHLLEPLKNEKDREAGYFDLLLPEKTEGTAEFVIGPGLYKSNAFDWTYWSELQFKVINQ